MTSIIRVEQSKFVTVPIDEDSHERILNCIQTPSELEATPAVHESFLKDTKAAPRCLAKAVEWKDAESTKAFLKKLTDHAINYDEDIGKATGSTEISYTILVTFRSSPFAGSPDPISYVKMHEFNIMLDVLLVNQTLNTLQNLCLDFTTLGDLKLVELPGVYTNTPLLPRVPEHQSNDQGPLFSRLFL
ncbi:hypothetical protein PILCRDRAFT_542 [Piloderma croceum F 1598]|uniref:Coatomer beta subunit C-terminal domain-containing protein n=1 Tax=Piloderma croceum (strain F 1598) TaxID=765440 RepID=A0A0C3CNL5_PILCF|nr:hypothetical protein PILCRDRAFT_542 [Piloderma croceum F 1598]